MTLKEIPRSEWRHFLESFAHVHAGWLVTLADEEREAPLEAVNVTDDEIVITLGESELDFVAPRRVAVLTTEEGADAALEIDTAGARTRLTFRVAALPETVDGVAGT